MNDPNEQRSVSTHAIVEVTLQVLLDADVWSGAEPGLGRAFRDAEINAANIIENALGHAPEAYRRKVTVMRVGKITMRVEASRREPEGT